MDDEQPIEETSIPSGTPLYQISQEDVETLERLMPELMWASATSQPWSTSLRVRWEKVKRIVTGIRWDGGPPLKIERIDAE